MNTPQNTYWNPRDGRKILIADMDLDHVINCSKMMQLLYGVPTDNKLEPRQFLCKLITEAELHNTLSALTDPNL